MNRLSDRGSIPLASTIMKPLGIAEKLSVSKGFRLFFFVRRVLYFPLYTTFFTPKCSINVVEKSHAKSTPKGAVCGKEYGARYESTRSCQLRFGGRLFTTHRRRCFTERGFHIDII